MVESATIVPARRSDLQVSSIGNDGRCIVKDRRTGGYFQLGSEEAFLFERLDGSQTTESVCRLFQERFGEPLSLEDLYGFVALARDRRLLASDPAVDGAADHQDAAVQAKDTAHPRQRQSLLFWRHRLFDPDRLMTWLEPKVRFCWTRSFLLVAGISIAAASVVTWTNGAALVSHFAAAFRWETLLLAWVTLFAVTMGHEFAHGLTCKHYGGEVREIGFILIFLLPAFYCNVSDAWLFREKSKRLWVTFAGGFFDLLLWSIAVLCWRVLQPGTLANHLAWVVLTVLSARVFFNFNPFLKLDGYYLLSDLLELPNLRERSTGRMQAWVRSWLWGAPRPTRIPRGIVLFWIGLATWVFSLSFLVLMLTGLGTWAASQFGGVGITATAVLAIATVPTMFRGFAAGEIRTMLRRRPIRLCLWGVMAVGVPSGLYPWEVVDRHGGAVELQPMTRVEVRATAAGFLRELLPVEGQAVTKGDVLATLEMPDLATRIAQTDAEIREADSKLKLLEIGQRPEETEQLRRRVERAQIWKELADAGLERARKLTDEDMTRLSHWVTERQAELDQAAEELRRSEQLLARKAMTPSEHQGLEAAFQIAKSQWEQANAVRRSRLITGVHDAEEELTRRGAELAEAEAELSLAEAGTRPEEIAAARAGLESLRAERNYLYELSKRLEMHSPITGLIATPNARERIGQYLQEGEPICEVIDATRLRAEIQIDEEHATKIRPDQLVEVKLRAVPEETFTARVLRIAPVAEAPAEGLTGRHVRVECELNNPDLKLRPAMTGYARIYGERKPLGELVWDRASRYVRTEFWW
ncbi:MAG: efflux RND transporter periplasmic adaptor subunit [Planctomycetaceae bacterium]